MILFRHFALGLLAVVLTATAAVGTAHGQGAVVYQNYVIRQDQGWDILCAPYRVRPNEWVLKIFKLRGEIALKDFPEFLRIFSRINPHIRDVNRIRPGQAIYIPLKRVPRGSLPGQASGLVTIPFVDLKKKALPAKTPGQSVVYQVQRGDTISQLIAGRFGRFGTQAYRDGIESLKQLNPGLKNLDLIYSGQMLALPGTAPPPTIRAATVPTPKPAKKPKKNKRYPVPKAQTADPAEPVAAAPKPSRLISPLAEVAAILDADLRSTGKYHFPRANEEAIALDLTQRPMLRLQDGTRFLVGHNQPLADTDLAAIQGRWPKARQLKLDPDQSVDTMVRSVLDHIPGKRKQGVSVPVDGLAADIRAQWILPGPGTDRNPVKHICITFINHPRQRTPTAFSRYLLRHGIRLKEVLKVDEIATAGLAFQMPKDGGAPQIIRPKTPKETVRGLMAAIGYAYAENVTLTFPYAGIQVQALSNLATAPGGQPMFIDFGDIFGDAFKAISESGFRILSIPNVSPPEVVCQKILTALKIPTVTGPSFLVADRPVAFNTTLRMPSAMLIGDHTAKKRTLISFVKVDPAVGDILRRRGMKVVSIVEPSSSP